MNLLANQGDGYATYQESLFFAVRPGVYSIAPSRPVPQKSTTLSPKLSILRVPSQGNLPIFGDGDGPDWIVQPTYEQSTQIPASPLALVPPTLSPCSLTRAHCERARFKSPPADGCARRSVGISLSAAGGGRWGEELLH